VYWRAENNLVDLSSVRPVGFFAWNAQTFLERWVRHGLVLLVAVLRPFLYLCNPAFATRVVHTVLRGVSRDRLDLLGEEYCKYRLEPYLKPEGLQKFRQLLSSGSEVVLVSSGLDRVMRPLARQVGAKWLIANRLEFRDGITTGRLLEPVISGQEMSNLRKDSRIDNEIPADELAASLGLGNPDELRSATIPATRRSLAIERPVVHFAAESLPQSLSVRKALSGKNVMLIGVTGFIGKVWLVNTLMDLPEIGTVYLLIRSQKSNPAQRRFERLVEESPVFDPLYRRYGSRLSDFLRERIQIVEGDVCSPGLGVEAEVSALLRQKLDLVINSSGLTDFNPDLRDALATNVDAVLNILEFVRQSDRAGLIHLSTCYVAGDRDGRISEKLKVNYTPNHVIDFDAEQERLALHESVKQAEQASRGPEVTKELLRQALAKEHAAKDLHGTALENQVRKNRIRWMRNHLTEAGIRRAKELGWPNTYTFTKSLAESLIVQRGAELPIAVVRPSIVETSIEKPFRGWNEGINTSASLSYLLGTSFRQLPSNQRKRLDIIPVDQVCCGMTLIAAAVVERRHQKLYQLATSVTNPCDMRRSIELTSLAHRKHYRAQEGLEYWLRLRLDAIPVSKERYNRMSAPAQKAIIQSIQRIMAPLPLKKTPLAKAERNLEKVEKLIELFEPFILRNEHDFVADNIAALSHTLIEDEKADFSYDTSSIDWWDYWINIHIPALRKWTYPLIEGRPLEARPARNFQLDAAESNVMAVKTGTNGATWRYS
jgi:thioester reductase-like protein